MTLSTSVPSAVAAMVSEPRVTLPATKTLSWAQNEADSSGTTAATIHFIPAKKVARVGLPENDIAEVIEFDPSLERGRLDVDIRRWAHLTGILPTHALAPDGKNAWKNEPNRDTSHLDHHLSRGYPTPPGRIAECQGIARRNARELAEQMGYADFTRGLAQCRKCRVPTEA